MDSCRSRQLCQTTDGFLHFTGTYHHQIRQLVHDNDDLRHLLRPFLSLGNRHGLNLFIIALQITDIIIRELPVTVFHLTDTPVQCGRCLLRICHNRDQQMRNAVIHTQFYDLRIYHDQFYIIRMCLVQNTHDQGIDTYGFTGTGSSGDQHMGHLGNICHYRLARNILTYGKSNVGIELLEFLTLQQIPECHGHIFFVRDFDTDGCLAGNRCLNTNIRCRQIQLNIIRQTYDLGYFHPLLRL